MANIETRLNALLQNLEQQHALPSIALGLDRMLACLERLGNPQLRVPPVIHIAGTNGKGSTLAMLKSMLQSQGKHVHTYTSPHLVHFSERIVLCGKPVDSQQLYDALLRVMDAAADTIPLTFFEATTIAAFICFAEVPADVLLLEVGLGGRLDATNVVPQPLAIVITPIDIDHKEFLGETRTLIAAEKAGIMKAGVPVIVAAQHADAKQVLSAHAKTLHAPLHYVERPLSSTIALGLKGAHQYMNAACAVEVYKVISRPLGLGEVPYAALACTTWPARLQRLQYGPLVQSTEIPLWLDGGHNPAAAEVLAEWLRGKECFGLVVGMMARKDVYGFLSPFCGLVTSIAAVNIDGEADGLEPDAIVEAATALGIKRCIAVPNLTAALDWHRDTSPVTLNGILICGSLYLAGKVLQNHA